jgi:transcriptional regulator with XRE-family HTH domain
MTINCQQKNNSDTIIGERIKIARKAKKLTQADLAEKLHLTQGFIGHIEKGRNMPTLDQIMRMAIVLDCNITWLATGEGKTRSTLEAFSDLTSGRHSESKTESKLEAKLRRIIEEGDQKKIKAVEAQLDLLDPGENIQQQQPPARAFGSHVSEAAQREAAVILKERIEREKEALEANSLNKDKRRSTGK